MHQQHCLSGLLKYKQDVLICSVAPPSLFKVADAGTTYSVRIRRVVIEDATSTPVEATYDHKVTLVFWLPAEALLAHRKEAAVFDR